MSDHMLGVLGVALGNARELAVSDGIPCIHPGVGM